MHTSTSDVAAKARKEAVCPVLVVSLFLLLCHRLSSLNVKTATHAASHGVSDLGSKQAGPRRY